MRARGKQARAAEGEERTVIRGDAAGLRGVREIPEQQQAEVADEAKNGDESVGRLVSRRRRYSVDRSIGVSAADQSQNRLQRVEIPPHQHRVAEKPRETSARPSRTVRDRVDMPAATGSTSRPVSDAGESPRSVLAHTGWLPLPAPDAAGR